MQKLKMLVLTDHKNHSVENSLYPLVKAMREHPRCEQLDVATRVNPLNAPFFKEMRSKNLFVSKADESFKFWEDGRSFKKNLRKESLLVYDVIWLRMPPPLNKDFLDFLINEFPSQFIINSPKGIFETGSKGFLLRFPNCCPPMKICRSAQDIIEFKSQFPIVLKPFREYGGRGIIRIDGNQVWDGNVEMTFDEFLSKNEDTEIEYLGVKFLKNVSEGDKRIVVVNGQIMGASLRLPPEDSWICNVAMGGSSGHAKVDDEEVSLVAEIDPVLSEMGIVMYGVDTLVDDNGKRVLSEINTTSIGGLPQIEKLEGKPLLREAADLIWKYIASKTLVS
jgi:glutathione synthase